MLDIEQLRAIAIKSGVDVCSLPDNLITTYLAAILEAVGGESEDLPDKLATTYLSAFLEHTGNFQEAESFSF